MKKSSEVVIYKTQDNQIEVAVFLNNDTVWLNRKQISALFERDVKTIGKHINNVFSDGELDFISVVAKFATTAQDGKTYQVDYYNLDEFLKDIPRTTKDGRRVKQTKKDESDSD